MKIAILGTRGIPNNHGGFEQFAEHLSVHLANKGHDISVYNSHNHPYTESEWNGVQIIHKYDPEDKIGTAGQFVYDFNCILDSRKRGFDVILQLGYTSSSVWGRLLPSGSTIITNMDGLEWKRSKYSKYVRKFLKYAEKLGVKTSDFLVSDSIGIQNHIKEKYSKDSTYIAYGAYVFHNPDVQTCDKYQVRQFEYDMLIARLEPENNIEVILDGVVESNTDTDFLVIGKHETKFGEYLKSKYKNQMNIRFLGGIYNQEDLNNLRFYSNLYFHGHSVGGTNPSLLEAMGSNSFIIANDNIFNKSILGQNAFYFKNKNDVINHIKNKKKADFQELIDANKQKILTDFKWDLINNKYEKFMIECFEK